uniref:Poly [ADP-ribose] polymerase n=1 Tax=Sinocyclocheilus rhinocerous TaxID=307959 RepID=A0A673I2X4_9TELE
MADDKLYKAEYAKSGRASCKKCKENIAKASLRMAIMVQSPMFDGKVPHWHHFSCFWLRAAVQSPSDISGFTDLRWDDQEKVKKAIESGGATGGKGEQKGAAKGEKTLNDFAVEYAKANRSTCKGCDQKIEKDHIRVSKKTVDPEKPQLGLIDRWYHTACFVSRREELLFKPEYSAAQLKGFAALRDEDKEELKKRLPAVKNEGKRKIDDVDGGVSKKQKKEDEKLELKQLKEQSQMIWGIKDKLKKFCSINDMKELLIANNQEVPSGESNIIDRLSDCMAFGSLKPCETCKGQLVFKSDAYYCTGDISAWTKCVFKTQTPDRKDWVTPKEFSEIPFLKKFKFKRQDRVFPKDAPPAAPTPSSAAATVTSAAPSASTAANKPLTGLKLLAVGKLRKNKDELKNAVEVLGGKITGTANKAALCLSSKKEIEKMSKKMEEVRDAGVRVVAEDFLTDIKESGKALQELISLHAISPWGAEVKVEFQAAAPASKSTGAHSSKSTSRVKEEEGGSKSKKMKLTVKGGAAVDPDSGLENCAHVLDQNGKIYSATLGLVDIVRGTNSYYKLQLLEDDVKKQYWVFRSWGRVGTTIGGNKLDKFYDKNSAMDNFCSVYEEKTGNAWASSNFTKYPNKFYPLEIDYGQDEEAVKKLTASTGAKSKLDKPIQDLIRMIFDVESMKKAMVEFEIDLQKMPLGKLSKRQIQSAYSLLSEVQQVGLSGSETQILDLSNRFYTLIPHDFGMKKPPLLNNMDYIQQKVQMLDNLLDIEVAYSLLRGGVEDNKKDPIDINYEKLKTKIEVVEQSSSEAQLILQYLKNTHAATHNTYTLDVEEIFKIDREGESQRFRPFKELQNRQLLWHGSRTTNYAGILSQGLRIAPPEAPVTGYMFGKGVYFADMVSKSANYCHTSQADPVEMLFLTAPDPRATVSLNGVDVPLGKGINTNTEDTSLLYNEYIVYDIAQVNLKYLLKIRFNYQTSLW